MGFAEVTSKHASISSSDHNRVASGILLGGIGFSNAQYMARTVLPAGILSRTLSITSRSDVALIIAIQWLGHPSQRYIPRTFLTSAAALSRSIKKVHTDFVNSLGSSSLFVF